MAMVVKHSPTQRNHNHRHLVPSELSFIQAVRSTFPAHYALFNSELHFSNMLLADDRLKNRSVKILFQVSDWITVTVKYHVRPFIVRHMAKLYWLIRYKLLLDNFRLHTFMDDNDSNNSVTANRVTTPLNSDTKLNEMKQPSKQQRQQRQQTSPKSFNSKSKMTN